MKKNKVILTVSTIMILSAMAPMHFWQSKDHGRFPASDSSVVEVFAIAEPEDMRKFESNVQVFSIPETKNPITYEDNIQVFAAKEAQDMKQYEDEEIVQVFAVKEPVDMKKFEMDVVVFAQPESKNKIEVIDFSSDAKSDDLIACQKDDSDKLSDDMKKLIQDKEELLAEIALLKGPKTAEVKIEEAKDVKAPESKVDIMSQLSSLMMSQQAQQEMMMQMMMQMMNQMQANQESNNLNNLFSPYGLSHDQYQSHARVNGHAPTYNFYNSNVTMGQPQAQDQSVLSQFSNTQGVGLAHGQTIASPYAMNVNLFQNAKLESMGEIQNPMYSNELSNYAPMGHAQYDSSFDFDQPSRMTRIDF